MSAHREVEPSSGDSPVGRTTPISSVRTPPPLNGLVAESSRPSSGMIAINRSYRLGPPGFLVATVAAFINPAFGMVVIVSERGAKPSTDGATSSRS